MDIDHSRKCNSSAETKSLSVRNEKCSSAAIINGQKSVGGVTFSHAVALRLNVLR